LSTGELWPILAEKRRGLAEDAEVAEENKEGRYVAAENASITKKNQQKTVSVTISGIYFIFPLMVTDTVFDTDGQI
jgi:hypothetical protein